MGSVFPEACAQLARQVGGVVQEEGEDEERARRVRRRRQQREREQAQRAADAEEEVDDDSCERAALGPRVEEDGARVAAAAR